MSTRDSKTLIDIGSWLDRYIARLKDTFGERIWFVGLQGSYGRGEATAGSDIDMVVILNALSTADIGTYRAMLDTLEHRELVCGFLAGRKELRRWEPADLFQFCHDTNPILGNLDSILEQVDDSAVNRAIRMGACNIYHGCVHNMLFERSAEALRGLYKAATFVIRARVFQEKGCFCRGLRELSDQADPGDREVVEAYMRLNRDGVSDFCRSSESLFAWTQRILQEE